ncbi:glutamate synthase (NADPH/NADH) small chain [Arboricoccus pini]|uniref:dihydrouracil dehydrogenase (NAD(+)) n=1 Tax=Arboricoccus pini TaxID=1963835 RepID=A0A212R7A2_9PROT|nr:NAD(P)-dependent oxidoreductase [Arboricoccus pini]SNB68071.1 glutamate synthase (NADPH/NADH) small chain [Arboricoccus pini]
MSVNVAEVESLLAGEPGEKLSSRVRGGRLQKETYERNFDDLHPPFTVQEAVVEADRCYFCHDAPCLEACPTGIDIPGFIRGIQTGNVEGAGRTILGANILGGSCARVCPTEILCEGACVWHGRNGKPVKIGALQRYATDWLMDRSIQPFVRASPSGKRVAVVGAGPAGLACAHHLSRLGHDVIIFEQRAKAGGLNEYGIAAYKVPHDFAQREIAYLMSLGGIEIRHGLMLGRDFDLPELLRGHDAVFLAIGLGAANRLGLPNEDLAGVEDAVAYIAALRQADDLSKLEVGEDVVVIGGGNTAIDIAIQAKRLGAVNVTIAYRRGSAEMSATSFEQELAQINGCTIRHWAAPVALHGKDGRLTGVEFATTETDPGGKLVIGEERFLLPADQLFKAIGQTLDRGAFPTTSSPLVETKIRIDSEFATSIIGVFAGGDCVSRDQDLTVVAVEDGKRAAAAIHNYLQP